MLLLRELKRTYVNISVQEKYIDIARSLIIKADPLRHFQQSLSLAIGKIKTIGLNAPQTTHSLCDHFPPGNRPVKCINAPTVPRLGRIEIQGGNLTLEPCDRIIFNCDKDKIKGIYQHAGCRMYELLVLSLNSRVYKGWADFMVAKYRDAECKCWLSEGQKNALLTSFATMRITSLCIFALPPNVTLGAIQSQGQIVASH